MTLYMLRVERRVDEIRIEPLSRRIRLAACPRRADDDPTRRGRAAIRAA